MNLCRSKSVTIYLCTEPSAQGEQRCQYYDSKDGWYCRFRRVQRITRAGGNELEMESEIVCVNPVARQAARKEMP